MPNVNLLDTMDSYALINELHTQATGEQGIQPVDESSFISMATSTLAVGYDRVFGELSKMISRSVFSSRVYSGKFKGLLRNSLEWGAYTRKVSFADKEAQPEKVYHDIQDLTSVDHWIQNNAEVLETHFYGSVAWEDWITYRELALRDAFRSSAEFGSFVASMTTEWNNKYTQWREEQARMLLCNGIASKIAMETDSPESVIHLITEYNAFIGADGTQGAPDPLTATSIYLPENKKPFFEWVHSRIGIASREMTERSGLFQIKFKNKNINRHTPVKNQKLYLSADALSFIDSAVNTEVYHNDPLRYADVEAVGYWQAIKDPNKIQITPNVIDSNGAVVQGDPQTIDNVFGVLFDEEAMVINIYDESSRTTPENARARYWNVWFSCNLQYCLDLSEKIIVLKLD